MVDHSGLGTTMPISKFTRLIFIQKTLINVGERSCCIDSGFEIERVMWAAFITTSSSKVTMFSRQSQWNRIRLLTESSRDL